MRAIKISALAVSFAALPACKPEAPPQPDQEEISRSYCIILQMCAPEDEKFGSNEECESHSADEFEQAEADSDEECVDARLDWEACIGEFETCDEYRRYRDGDLDECRKELDVFYNYCMVI